MSEQMERWQALADAATPGEWRVCSHSDMHQRDVTIFVGMQREPQDRWWDRDSTDLTPADATFIAEARTAVPALIVRVRELEAALREALEEAGPCDPHYPNSSQLRHEMRMRLPCWCERARAALNPAVQPGPPGMQFPATCARCGRHAAMPAGDNVCGSCGDDLRQEDMAESAALAQPSAPETSG